MRRYRWTSPSIVGITLIAAASVGIPTLAQELGARASGPLTGPPQHGAHSQHADHSEHSSLNALLPAGATLHGITPIERSRSNRVDATLISIPAEPRALAVDEEGSLWIAHREGLVTWLSSEGSSSIELRGTLTAAAILEGVLYVTDMDADRVVGIDVSSKRIISEVDVPAGPVALIEHRGMLIVACVADGLVLSIDPSTGRVSDPTPVGFGPIALAARGEQLAVVNALDRTVVIGRLSKGLFMPTETVDVPAGASDAVFFEGSLWVASATAGTVVRIDPRRGEVVGRSLLDPLSQPGLGPSTLLVDRGEMFVVNSRDRSIVVLGDEEGAQRMFGEFGNATPVTYAAVVWEGAIVIADSQDDVLARLPIRAPR